MTHFQPLKNEDGILTLDFIFASLVVFAFSAIIFSFCMTLSIVEVVQYVSFSTARLYSLGHMNENEQNTLAEEKYTQLTTNPALATLFTSGWFEVRPVILSDFNAEFSADPSADSNTFIGARIPFSAPILYKRIPIVGTTASDPDGFTANIQSFLAKEPNFDDCQSFMLQRAGAFLNLGTYTFNANDVVPLMDNGC